MNVATLLVQVYYRQNTVSGAHICVGRIGPTLNEIGHVISLIGKVCRNIYSFGGLV